MDPQIEDTQLYLAFQLMKQKEFAKAKECLDQGLGHAQDQGDETVQGLYLSALGVLFKLQKDFKTSYKYYQQAEKFLKDDNSIKIITAVLLIEEFHQYDTAIRKLQKVVQNSADDPGTQHHALAQLGRAYLALGKKDQVEQCFEQLLSQDFAVLRSASNVDFKFVEGCVAKKFALDLCQKYLEKALTLAQSRQESVYIQVVQALLKGVQSL